MPKAQELWDDYTEYKDQMFKSTNTDQAPWIVINANQKTSARIEALSNILDQIPYQEAPTT